MAKAKKVNVAEGVEQIVNEAPDIDVVRVRITDITIPVKSLVEHLAPHLGGLPGMIQERMKIIAIPEATEPKPTEPAANGVPVGAS